MTVRETVLARRSAPAALPRMTSRTTIRVPPSCTQKEGARPWHLLRVHCESLHRSGLPYQVQFDLPNGRIVILAEGTPQPIPPRRPPRYAILPPRMTLAQARQGLAEQLRLIDQLRREVRSQWRSWRLLGWRTSYSPDYREEVEQGVLATRAKRARFGRWLASVCARQRSRLCLGGELRLDKTEYASCDAALGWRCPRQSQLSKCAYNRGWLWAVTYRYLGLRISIEPFRKRPIDPPPDAPPPATQLDRIREYRCAKVDLEYWQEMIRLTGGGVPNER